MKLTVLQYIQRVYFSRVLETGRVQVIPDLGLWFQEMTDARQIHVSTTSCIFPSRVEMGLRYNSGVGLEEKGEVH